MLGRIVEIEGRSRRLSLERGFLAVAGPDGPVGKVPLDDIDALILADPSVSLTSQALAALAARGAPVVVCGGDFRPAAYLLPVHGHHAQGARQEAQAAAALPLRKRLWAEIVRAKIRAQAAAVERSGRDATPIAALASRVRSGDPENLEAQAAQRYWPVLFGRDFRRAREADDANAFLNYGYTVLRAATARAIVAAGLSPSLALMHRSRGDALRLADDLMEPFRPVVDLVALDLSRDGAAELSADAKRRLVAALHFDFPTVEGAAPMTQALARLAVSLAQVYEGRRKTLALPLSPLPLEAETGAQTHADGA